MRAEVRSESMGSRRRASILALLCGAVLLPAAGGTAEAPDPAAPIQGDPDASRCRKGGLGLDGYDPVSFYSGPEPVLGRAELSLEHEGATYRFASEASRERFAADPAAFLPRYGGWCAMTLALGRLACPDVLNFEIQDGELLLFETTVFTNGRIVWNRDPQANLERADANYQRIGAR